MLDFKYLAACYAKIAAMRSNRRDNHNKATRNRPHGFELIPSCSIHKSV